MDYCIVGVWFAVALCLSFLSKRMLEKISGGRSYRLLFFPGEILFEASYAISCYLTGTTITRLKMLDQTEDIGREPCPVPVVGTALISLAPLLGCMIALSLLFSAGGGVPNAGSYLRHSYDFSIQGAADLLQNLVDLSQAVLSGLIRRESDMLAGILLGYVTVSFAIFIAPTTREMKYALPAVLLTGLALWGWEACLGGVKVWIMKWTLAQFLFANAAFFVAMNLVFLGVCLVTVAIMTVAKAALGSSGGASAAPAPAEN